MNKIIKFIQSQSKIENISEYSIDDNKLFKSFTKIKMSLNPSEVTEKNIFQIKNNPKSQKGQIWLCKQQYYDELGNDIVGNMPYLVVLVSDVERIAEKEFVRVRPISPFIEFKADDEILVEDDNIVGFPFIIEIWNEQPILTDLLEEFVSDLNIDNFSISEAGLSLTEIQKEFRKAEIRNTAYLRQSINSLLEYEEYFKENNVFINFNNSIIAAFNTENMDNNVNYEQSIFQVAAKKGNNKNRKSYLFEKEIDGIRIQLKIIKDEKEYIIAVQQPDDIVLKDSKNNTLTPSSKNLYDGLLSGLYIISLKENNNTIRLILK